MQGDKTVIYLKDDGVAASAPEAFSAEHAAAIALMDKIRAALDDHLGYAPDSLNWGHVGTMGMIVEKLRELSQALP